MRYEHKYLVPSFQIAALQAALHPFVRLDKYAADSPSHEYTVRSIYFDTPDFEMYHTKQDHIAHRLKVRLRGYNTGNDDSTVFMEIKRKYEAPIVKNRCSASFGVVKEMFAGGNFDSLFPETVRVDDARRFFYQIYSRNLRPVVNVIYDREAYFSAMPDKANDCRLTIDKHWRCTPFPGIDQLYEDFNMAYVLDGHAVLEVKFNHYCPGWLKPILYEFDLQKGPASKYVACINGHPDIRPDKNRLSFLSVPFLVNTPKTRKNQVETTY